MKKSFLLILCLLLTIALVACANKDNKENEDTTAADITTAEVTTAGGEETSADASTESTSVEETSVEETSSEEESTSAEETTTGLVQTHEHTFEAEWTADDNGHWHAASCEHKGETADFGAHADANGDEECDVCEYDLSCEHPLSSDLEGIAAGHYHVTDCEHDLILDLTAHTGTEDGVCDACEFSFDDLIDEITAPEAGNRVNSGTVSYHGQYETREASFKAGFGFLFIDENVEYSYDPGVIINVKHSIHLFNNGNPFYVKEENGMVNRESWGITADNIKGYKFSSDMYDYLDLGTDPCGTEDLLYVFYNFAKTNCANNLTVTWGETNTITFKVGNEYSAKIFVIDFAISANGVITSLNLSMTKYNAYDTDDMGEPIGDAKYTIDDNGVITVAEGAVADIVSTIAVAQTEGSREDIQSSYNLDEIILKSYEFKLNDTVITDTINVEVGASTIAMFDAINPTTADLVLDNITVLALDETGAETYSVNSYVTEEGLYIYAYKAGNYVLKLTTLATEKTYAVVATAPETTEIHAAVDNWGSKEAFDSKNLYIGAAFEFCGVAQNTFADATFTAEITEGPAGGATLTELETADGYSFTATTVGTYVVTLTSKVNPAVTGTVTFNVTEAPSVGDNFKGTWEYAMFGIIVEINPTDATSGTYTITVNNAPAQYSYTLVGTTIDATCVAGVDQGWSLQFNSNLELEILSPFGIANPLTQTSTGDEGGDAEGFNGTYSGVIDNMGTTANVTVVAGPESFDFTMDGATVTYYYSMDEFGNLSVVPLGEALGNFSFRYIAETDMLAVEMPHPMTGMNVEIGALAKGGSTTPDVGGVTIDGTFKGECPDYYGTVFTITFDGNTMHVKDESMGGEVTFTYTVNEYGELALTYVSGEEMVVMDLQFVYYADTEILVVNRLNPMTGMYGWVGQLEKEATAPAISGTFTGECPDYYGTVFTITFDGNTMHVKDESMGGEVTFTYTVNEYGELALTYVSGEEMVVMDLQFVYYADTQILVVNRLNPMTGMYGWVGQLEKVAAPAGTIEGTFNGVCPEYWNTEFTVTFNGDTMHIKDENMGGEVTYTYTIDEYGTLVLTYVSGEQMVIDSLQFVYYADTQILVVNRLNPMTGMYGWAGELTIAGADTGLSIDGTWVSVDGKYQFTFWESDGDGNVNFMDENGDWLSTKGFYFTLSEDGVITFTLKTTGYGDWSGANATAVEGFITIVLDSGETVMLLPA